MRTDMEFLKLLLHIGLILATITDFCISDDSVNISRLPKNTKPLHYNISLITHVIQGNIFRGETSIIIEILYPSSIICLHSKDLEINNTMTTLIDRSGTIFKPMEHTDDEVTNILTLNFGNLLPRGIYILSMEYVGHLSQDDDYDQNGLMSILYTDKEEVSILFASFFEPNYARRVFPCWDEPELKATFNISVMHHPKYTVLSNMPMREQNVEQTGMMWTHFNTTPVMSTYLVGIVISNFVRVGNANKTVNMWCRSSLTSKAKYAHSIAEKIPPLLVKYTNSSEKIPKMDHVMIYNYPTKGMEHWGLIIYNEKEVIYDNSTDPTFKRRLVASLVTHELVYQWFGNLVTPSWWPYLWLSHGFAAFFEAYFLNKIFENWRTMDFLVIQRLHKALTLDNGLLNSVTFQHNDNFEKSAVFNTTVYDKASAILRMLHHAVGDEVFQKGIITYLATNQYRSVTPDDLWSAMQSALEEVPYIPYMQDQDFKINVVMDTWINQNCYPVLNVTRNYKTGEVAVTQRSICATNYTNNKWWIPMTFADKSNLDFSNTMPNHWLGPDQTSSLEINSRDWIIVNVQQTAYCRVYYDTTNLRRIIRYLKSEQYTNIHVLNRAQIIDDAFAFLQRNQLDSSVFMNLISYLKRERDYVAWHPMFRILAELQFSKFLSLPESEGFKKNLIGIFDELLQNVGYDENPNDDDITKMLRIDATKWACTIGHAECNVVAAVKLSEHLADPDIHKVPQWWQYWTYCFGLTIASRATWDKVMELYQRTSDKRFLKILSCAKDPDIIINYLNITASNTTLFDDKKHAFIFKIILKDHARNDLILDYILANFDNIKPRVFAASHVIKKILSGVYSNKQISKVKRFAETNFHHNLDTLLDIIDLTDKRKKDLKRSVDTFTKQFGNIKLK